MKYIVHVTSGATWDLGLHEPITPSPQAPAHQFII